MMRRILLALAFAFVAAACGKRGDPKPPVPIIPQATTDLVVTQRADKVVLAWSYPSLTTAGRSLKDIDRITVYRYVEELPESAVESEATPGLPSAVDTTVPQPIALFAKIPIIPPTQFAKLGARIDSMEKANLGKATAGAHLVYTDTPPLASPDGRPVRLTYAVVTEGATARGDFSNLATVVPLPVAVAPTGLTTEAKPEGVLLKWEEPTTSVQSGEAPIIMGYQIYRTSPGEAPGELLPPITTAPVKETTYTDTPSYGEHEYRVTAVATTGPPLLQSAPSEPAAVTFKDLLPPPAPTGVTALLETNLIRLLWDPVEAPDLAGYRIYRTEGIGHGDEIREAGSFALVPEPMTTTTYVDDKVNLGIAFRYGITSVDKNGNESAKVWTDWVEVPKTP